ncbi:MAG: ABC transporter ATP-binding protein, partial [Burkholderiales bacterium]|nr:ABC transporter ATP-binding protein [Burkholderiales bacterium]
TALDATIQAQILDLLRTLRKDAGMSIVLISHDLGVVAENSDRIAVMYAGRIVEAAPIADIFAKAAHPYTRGLLEALPDLDGPLRPLVAIPGTVPQPGAAPPGCSFAPRCSRAIAACSDEVPRRRTVAAGHDAACIRVAEVFAS